jgi:DNA polymerase III epsilon subunit-like protein
LDVLDQAGFVLSQKSVLQYFDTQVIAQYLYRTDLLSLRDLCTVLGISREGLHVSGNDATFTLVALLKMASMLLEYSENVKSSEMAVELVKLVSYANEELPFRKADYEPRRGHWRVRIYGPRAIWICAGILSLAFPLGWVQIRTEKS